jgi:hypothetical protein
VRLQQDVSRGFYTMLLRCMWLQLGSTVYTLDYILPQNQ